MELVDRIPEAMAILSAVAAVWWRIDAKFEALKKLQDESKDFNTARRSELWAAMQELERRHDQRFITYIEATANSRIAWRKEVEDAIRADIDDLREGINYLRNRIDTLLTQRAAP